MADAPVAGLLLAAGAGRRMGLPKALVRHDGRLFVESAAAVLADGGCEPVVVVLGARGEDVRASAALEGYRVVDNPDWAEGMGASVRVGLRALHGSDAVAALVLPVDVPGVTPAAVARVAALAAPDALARASYDGVPGHPVLIGAAHWRGVIESAVGDVGSSGLPAGARGDRRAVRGRRHRHRRGPAGRPRPPRDLTTPPWWYRPIATSTARSTMSDTQYDEAVRAHLSEVAEHNAAAIAETADLLLATVLADGLVLTAGAGHSLAAVAETFYRAGGLACVRPLYHPDLLPMHGAVSSTKAERRTAWPPRYSATTWAEHDMLVVFSTSGVNPYPVELACRASAAGRPVIAVTSGPASSVAPRRSHSTLAEQGSVVLDTLVPPGDSTYPPDAPVAAPISTVANAFLWNLVLVAADRQGRGRGRRSAVVAQFQRARRRRGQRRPDGPLHAPRTGAGLDPCWSFGSPTALVDLRRACLRRSLLAKLIFVWLERPASGLDRVVLDVLDEHVERRFQDRRVALRLGQQQAALQRGEHREGQLVGIGVLALGRRVDHVREPVADRVRPAGEAARQCGARARGRGRPVRWTASRAGSRRRSPVRGWSGP